ncbi:CapA family protein [Nocardia sp. NPDC046763]|uniref:CapA family protein n=1 Tax=Nocardia sp. NPDC046763 TaxID=3155256 RepID=UPI0033F0ECFE
MMMTVGENMETVLCAVGDVMVDRDDPPGIWTHVDDLLRAADLRVGNLEGCFTDRTTQAVSTHGKVTPALRNLSALPGMFDLVTGANNHILDGGHEGMLDTLDELHRLSIATCGFGRTLDEARKPAILERNGIRFAFLGYSSVFPIGYQARATVPGLVPIRAHTIYHVDNDFHAPGWPPDITTVPYEEDLAALRADIAAARAEADVVIGQFHWGEANRPAVLLEYEHAIARAAIDAGMDVVLGHHHHEIRGVEFYRDKPIFHGLGLFAFDLHGLLDRATPGMIEAWRKKYGEYGMWPREGWPMLPMHPDARLTMLAYLRFDGDRLTDVGFVPCTMTPDGRVMPRRLDSPEGTQVVDYLRQVTADEGLPTSYRPLTGRQLGGFDVMGVLPATAATPG